MLKYIIRLDDACPTMDLEKWSRMEALLDKYSIRPIVGIIPNCKDEAFRYKENIYFWSKTAKDWTKKGWIIALHGYEHDLNSVVRTEFAGIPIEEQEKKINEGIKILVNNGIEPVCFFAPNHTFDDNTVAVIKNHPTIKFISDGYAFYPYTENGMQYLPSVFDTPHRISNSGIFTFVYHPNEMDDEKYDYLENFIKSNLEYFDQDILGILELFKGRRRTVKDRLLRVAIVLYRKIKGTKR